MQLSFKVIVLSLTFFASQVSSAETVMVCDAAENQKRYYKLVKPFFGKPNVEQKIEGQWKDWCREGCKNLEIYDSGAKLLQQFDRSWDRDYPSNGIVAKQKYLLLAHYWLDFEFGTRRKKVSLFTNDIPMKELTNYAHRKDETYSCVVQ